MEVPYWEILLGTAVFLLVAYFMPNRKYARMPPGPLALPIIGSMLSLRGDDFREAMLGLKKKYGDIFTVSLGMDHAVILASYDVIKEAFVKQGAAFADRPPDSFLTTEINKHLGIVSSSGALWREQRKFAHGVFREFGIGRPVFEEKVHEEIEHLVEALKSKVGVPYDPVMTLQMTVSNVINNVTFGKRFDYDDSEFVRYIKTLNRNIVLSGFSSPIVAYPFLKHVPGDFFHYKEFRTNLEYGFGVFQGHIEEHKKNRSTGEADNYIDAYLEEADKHKHDKNSTFTDEQLLYTISDLFSAGSETTTTTLRWAGLYMIRQPDIQRRVHKEIDEVLGDRTPTMRDRANMPYCEAVLLEAQRVGDIVPLGVPHATNQDVELCGYRIPAGTTVMSFIYAVHRDERLWKDPYKFNPDRFLDAQGHINKDEHLIAFSMGKRVCLGESLARMELFLFFTAIMQKMSFKMPPGAPMPSEESVIGITNSPLNYKVITELRN